MPTKIANRLINETSPYLLQHAYNPVDWHPWGQEALEKAKQENRPLLISIGYSACHWCHVMEKECFEDIEVAKQMNNNFVCIKIDREERPDIDSLYMLAVQLMTQRGGWPLNIFALPDGRPIYGGTYFPKKQWLNVLEKIGEMYVQQPDEVQDYAEKLAEGIKQTELFKIKPTDDLFAFSSLVASVNLWKSRFDNTYGGPDRAPKFPMPVNYDFLLNYGKLQNDSEILAHVQLTLDCMSNGGIYDQIGGGFARYSVDALWKIPHFEKMLYDNAQLISLFAKASVQYKSYRYLEVVEQSISFLNREMMWQHKAFFAALDADSEGEEGKYYVWTKEELQMLWADDYDVLADYFQINQLGYWEDDKYVLLRNPTSNEKLKKELIDKSKIRMLNVRNKRTSPGLDDKIILGWNALTVSALCDAYRYSGNKKFLDQAVEVFDFISMHLVDESGNLFHSFKKTKSSVQAFLDDYSATISAALDLFYCKADERYYKNALAWVSKVDELFAIEGSPLFYFSSEAHQNPVARQIELNDNVIPSSNAMMARNLYHISLLSGKLNLQNKALKMLQCVKDELLSYPAGHALWANLALIHEHNMFELVFSGPDAETMFLEWHQQFHPNALAVLCLHSSDVPLLKSKHSSRVNSIYVCEGEKCYAPVSNVDEALKLVQKISQE